MDWGEAARMVGAFVVGGGLSGLLVYFFAPRADRDRHSLDERRLELEQSAASREAGRALLVETQAEMQQEFQALTVRPGNRVPLEVLRSTPELLILASRLGATEDQELFGAVVKFAAAANSVCLASWINALEPGAEDEDAHADRMIEAYYDADVALTKRLLDQQPPP